MGILLGLCGMSFARAAEVPSELDVLPKGQPVRAAIVVVVPPPELDQYVAKVEKAARKNPEWFREHSSKAAPGVPLPYDERMGLTREEYEEYLAVWDQREFETVQEVALKLEERADGDWGIQTIGGAEAISLLRYDPEKDVMISPNGELERLEDVTAEDRSILGGWSGHEWRFEEETSLGQTKENFAIGKMSDGLFGILVYRMQDVSSAGTPLYDKSLVVRFPLGEAGLLERSN